MVSYDYSYVVNVRLVVKGMLSCQLSDLMLIFSFLSFNVFEGLLVYCIRWLLTQTNYKYDGQTYKVTAYFFHH